MAWAGTMNHLIKNATPKRRSLLKDTFTTDNGSEASIVGVIGSRTVGRSTKANSKVKRKLAYSCQAKNLWKSKKHLQQFKNRQIKQSKSISKSSQFKTTWKYFIKMCYNVSPVHLFHNITKKY